MAIGVALEIAARKAATSLTRSLEPVASLTYASAGVSFDGSMRLKEPRLTLHMAGWEGRLHARSADIRGSNGLWLLGRLLSPESAVADQLSIQTRALRFGQDSSANALSGWLGTSSLVPFENLGCGSDPLSDKDRSAMGIDVQERIDRLEYRFETDGGKLHLSMELKNPDISDIHGFVEFSGLDVNHWKEISAQPQLRIDRAGIHYEDSGYLVRRNQFCAQWVGSSATEFIDRHVQAVEEFLDARGIRPSRDLLGLYQKLVTRGGTLALTSLPDSSWTPIEISAYPRQNLLRHLNVTTRLGDAPPIMFRLAFADPDKPLRFVPQQVPVETFFADASELVDSAVEGHNDAEAITPVNSDSAGGTSPPDPTESPESILPSVLPTSATEAIPSPLKPEKGLGSTLPPEDFRIIASAPPPPKDSILALVWKPGVIERLPAQAPKKQNYRVVALAELGAQVGEDVRLLTINGKRVSGELMKVTADHAVLKIRVGRGEAELDVALNQIREVRVPMQRD